MTLNEAIYNIKQAQCIPYKHETISFVIRELNRLKEFDKNGAKPWFTAKWVRDRGKSRKCSRCDFSINEDDAYIFFFCPNCGAQMEVDNEN